MGFEVRKVMRVAIPIGVALFAASVLMWAIGEFFSLRGVVHMLMSIIFLAIAYLAALVITTVVIYCWASGNRKRLFWTAAIVLFIVAIIAHFAFPMQKPTRVDIPVAHERPANWRTIKDWQQAELAPVLEQFPNNTLRIVVTSSAPDETVDYAKQFKDFFRAHKWNVIGSETAATDQIVQNIQLSLSEQYWGKQRPEAFAAVESQMRFIGFRLRSSFVIDPLVSPKELVMWVGPETPPGFPEHIPLSLGMACQHPLRFTDDTMHFFGDPKDFVRWVRIQPPNGSHFSAGQRVLVVLSKPAKSVATSEQFNVQALGTVMPRPDALDVTVSEDLKAGEGLDMKIISGEDLRVKCVVDRSSQ
jgi:hypothetical protein